VPPSDERLTRPLTRMDPVVWESLLCAIGGGFFMGLYPLFIKTKPVLEANVHPVVFQLYKSTLVFLTAWILLIPRLTRKLPEGEPVFVFSWWGVVSAAFWVPSGLLTIGSVPLIGMAMQVAVSCAANAVLTFLVFWLVFGSKMKEYSCGDGCHYYRAPIYLAATVLGMFALIFAPAIAVKLGLDKKKTKADDEERQALLINTEREAAGAKKGKASEYYLFVLGMVLSVGCGVFAASQYAVLTVAKSAVAKENNCSFKKKDCPKDVTEAYDNFGSWLVSFGIGAIGVTLILLAIVSVAKMMQGLPLPALHWNVLKRSGVAAGICWSIANFLIIAGNVIHGNAVIMAQVLSFQIITSGLFGMLWYGEGGGKASKVIWSVAALWTLASMVLLGLEKSS